MMHWESQDSAQLIVALYENLSPQKMKVIYLSLSDENTYQLGNYLEGNPLTHMKKYPLESLESHHPLSMDQVSIIFLLALHFETGVHLFPFFLHIFLRPSHEHRLFFAYYEIFGPIHSYFE